MMTSAGQRVLSLLTPLLLVTAGHSTVEKMPAPRALSASLHASSETKPRPTPTRPKRTVQIASWYGDEFQGKMTANGEIFDQNKLTAASKTLPFNSLVKLTAPATGRSVIVRINDRGPWLVGRDFDLSEAAAEQLDIVGRGVARVNARVLGRVASGL